MTVTSETNKAQATGNGVVTVFFYPFQVPEAEWLEVYLDDVLQSAGFVVAGIGDPTGGSVTFTVAPAAGVIVTLLRVVPLTQEVDYQPYDPFPAEVAEGTLDKLTMITQQLQEEINRAWRVPIDTPPGVTIAPPPFSPGDVLGWSETEQNTLVNYPGIDTFTGLVDDAEAAAAAAAGSASAAAGSASAAAASANAAIVAKIEWRGVWDSGTAYVTRDAVEYQGSSYVVNTANTNQLPTNTAFWDLMAQKGAPGSGSGNVNGPATTNVNYPALWDNGTGTLLKQGTAPLGTAAYAATGDFATPASVALKANIASPAFSGVPTAPTPSVGDNSTKLATTAFVAANAGAGAKDGLFWENNQVVTADYTITSGQNAMTAGPISFTPGIVVTIPTGSTWSVI